MLKEKFATFNYLDLSYNRIELTGFKTIMGRLKECLRLEHLILQECGIYIKGERVVQNLLLAIQSNVSCKDLNLKGNQISADVLEIITRETKRNGIIMKLILNHGNENHYDEIVKQIRTHQDAHFFNIKRERKAS